MKANSVRLSRILHVIFLVAMVAVPVLVVAGFLNLEWMLQNLDVVDLLPEGVAMVLPLLGPVTIWMELLCLAATAPLTALTCAVFWRLAKLFRGYARGEVFTGRSVRLIRQVGVLILVQEAATPFVGAAMALILTMNNPPGHHMVTLGLSGANLAQVITGMALIVAAGVMDQARQLHEEAQLTI